MKTIKRILSLIGLQLIHIKRALAMLGSKNTSQILYI